MCTIIVDFLIIVDEQQWRNLVVFLEDQKIRFYRIEEREALRNSSSSDWPTALLKVRTHLMHRFLSTVLQRQMTYKFSDPYHGSCGSNSPKHGDMVEVTGS